MKVLDGCAIDGYFWVYIAAGTDVGVDVLIGDTVGPPGTPPRNSWYLFDSPDGTAFPNIQNVRALPCS